MTANNVCRIQFPLFDELIDRTDNKKQENDRASMICLKVNFVRENSWDRMT